MGGEGSSARVLSEMCRSARKNPCLSRADGRVERHIPSTIRSTREPLRRVFRPARPTGNNTRRAPIAVVDRRAAGRGTDAGRDVVETGGDGLDTHPGSGRGGVGGGLRGGRGADRPADGRGASLDASSRDASFRGRDGGGRGGDDEGGHAHAGCGTSGRRREATDRRSARGRVEQGSDRARPHRIAGCISVGVSPERKPEEGRAVIGGEMVLAEIFG